MPGEPELVRALGALCEPPDPAHPRISGALGLPGAADPEAHTDLFVFQLVPYASVYLGAEGMLGGEARDRVAGFWRALHLTPPAEPDHLAVLLGLYASLAERERDDAEPDRCLMWARARRTLLWEHLLTWVPAYARAVAETGPPFYAAWARLLSESLAAEAEGLDAPAAPLHLRDAPAPPDPETGGFVPALLAPARSGLIITRRDLARGARELGLGLRMGERAFALRALLDQDAPATLGWLAGEAGRWRERHAAAMATTGALSRHWMTRAEATRLALGRTRHTAMEAADVTAH